MTITLGRILTGAEGLGRGGGGGGGGEGGETLASSYDKVRMTTRDGARRKGEERTRQGAGLGER